MKSMRSMFIAAALAALALSAGPAAAGVSPIISTPGIDQSIACVDSAPILVLAPASLKVFASCDDLAIHPVVLDRPERQVSTAQPLDRSHMATVRIRSEVPSPIAWIQTPS